MWPIHAMHVCVVALRVVKGERVAFFPCSLSFSHFFMHSKRVKVRKREEQHRNEAREREREREMYTCWCEESCYSHKEKHIIVVISKFWHVLNVKQ